MKVVECLNSPVDYAAWYKYKVSFEEKPVRILVIVILVSAVISLLGTYSQQYYLVGVGLVMLLAYLGIWCFYCAIRLKTEIQEFEESGRAGTKQTLYFQPHGIIVSENGTDTFYNFKKIQKVREQPWYLFLYYEGAQYPLIINKVKIKTVGNEFEPYYIAKKLREQSFDYRYVKGDDLTYTGKYGKLITHSA